jgi:hypothetical protein
MFAFMNIVLSSKFLPNKSVFVPVVVDSCHGVSEI